MGVVMQKSPGRPGFSGHLTCLTCAGLTILAVFSAAGLQGCGDGDSKTGTGGSPGANPEQAASAKGTSSSAGPGAVDPRCVKPTPETIASGAYTPLSRPLFLYVNRKALSRPEVAAFLRYYLGDAQTVVPEVGYIRLPDETLKASQAIVEKDAAADAALDAKGTVVIDGSSTVYLISQAAAEDFQKKHKDIKVQVARSGTGGGFKKFVVGETDINGASRPIDKKEIAQCEQNKIEYVELKVAIDGLSVVVNQANDWCDCLSVEQLKALWEPNSKIDKWSDLDPKWPAEKIRLYGADSDSGTFDYFTEAIVGKAKSSRSDYNASGDDNTLVTGVRGDKFSLGYFGYAYYVENEKELKVLGIIPSAATPAAKTEQKK